METFDLVNLTEEALRIHLPRLQELGIEVERQIDPPAGRADWVILADKHLILQILVNLLGNAVRALDEQASPPRRITITVRSSSGSKERIHWEIADTGVGIAPEVMPRIFESGFTTRANGQGGFGLHTSAIAAEGMGGTLRAHSEGVGRGARFVLEFPTGATAERSARGDRA